MVYMHPTRETALLYRRLQPRRRSWDRLIATRISTEQLPFYDSTSSLHDERPQISPRIPYLYSPHLLAGRAAIRNSPLRLVTARTITNRRKLTAAFDLTRPT